MYGSDRNEERVAPSRPTLRQRFGTRQALRALSAAGFEGLHAHEVTEHFAYVDAWRRGTLSAAALAARTGWRGQGEANRSVAAASAFVDAKGSRENYAVVSEKSPVGL
jgi:hypothetical protein